MLPFSEQTKYMISMGNIDFSTAKPQHRQVELVPVLLKVRFHKKAIL